MTPQEMRIRAAEKRRRSYARLLIAMLMIALIVVGFGWLLITEIPAGNRDVLTTLLGAITGSVLTIVAYYFGDSEHSEI
jgi:hypothetical protein